jgi:polyhydroxyalkanoate synthesis regulator phasin
MKRILLAASAVLALGAAAPASAQLGDMIQREVLKQGLRGVLGGGSGRLEQLDDRIEQSVRRGEISQDQARRLLDEYQQLRRLDRDYRQGGLSRDERYELDRRISDFERRIESARYDRDGRYDNDDRYRDDRYNDGRGYDSSARNGCPPGLAKKGNGCLPPGQAKKNGGAYDYGRDQYQSGFGDRYRDTDQYIFRQQSDGRVLQIDRRTGQVVRVINRRR